MLGISLEINSTMYANAGQHLNIFQLMAEKKEIFYVREDSTVELLKI